MTNIIPIDDETIRDFVTNGGCINLYSCIGTFHMRYEPQPSNPNPTEVTYYDVSLTNNNGIISLVLICMNDDQMIHRCLRHVISSLLSLGKKITNVYITCGHKHLVRFNKLLSYDQNIITIMNVLNEHFNINYPITLTVDSCVVISNLKIYPLGSVYVYGNTFDITLYKTIHDCIGMKNVVLAGTGFNFSNMNIPNVILTLFHTDLYVIYDLIKVSASTTNLTIKHDYIENVDYDQILRIISRNNPNTCVMLILSNDDLSIRSIMYMHEGHVSHLLK